MPELPEVETVAKGLRGTIIGRKIKRVELRRGGLRQPFPPHFVKRLEGRTVAGVTRRAKYLLWELSGGMTLIAHLGMSGRFMVYAEEPPELAAHDHVVMRFADGGSLVYRDARRFGIMDLCETDALAAHPLLARLGPEPLERGFSAAYLKAALGKRKTAIKPTLMDHTLVAGVGNIYASEALFDCGIDPRAQALDCAQQAAALIASIRAVLRAALASGGSSLRDFFDSNGDPGRFQHHFKVYDREGKPCYACVTPVARLAQGGRSTFFCPSCQQGPQNRAGKAAKGRKTRASRP